MIRKSPQFTQYGQQPMPYVGIAPMQQQSSPRIHYIISNHFSAQKQALISEIEQKFPLKKKQRTLDVFTETQNNPQPFPQAPRSAGAIQENARNSPNTATTSSTNTRRLYCLEVFRKTNSQAKSNPVCDSMVILSRLALNWSLVFFYFKNDTRMSLCVAFKASVNSLC